MNKPQSVHPSFLTVLLSGRPCNGRAYAVLAMNFLLAFAVFSFINHFHMEQDVVRAAVVEHGGTPIFDSTTRTIAFLFIPYLFFIWLSHFILREGDFMYRDRPWKLRIEKLFTLKLGYPSMLAALVFGIISVAVFDFFVSSKLAESEIGRIARVLSDGFILIFGMSAFVAIVLRKE